METWNEGRPGDGNIDKQCCGRKRLQHGAGRLSRISLRGPARVLAISVVLFLARTATIHMNAFAAKPEVAAEASTVVTPKPVLTVGLGMRTGVAVSLNNPAAGDKATVSLDDGLLDQANLRPFMTAQLAPYMSFFASFEIGSGTPKGIGKFSILDAVMQLKFRPEFQVWVGQHIAANDRNNMNGPFFGNGWNFAIDVPSYPFDTGARDRGVTVWGLIKGGRVKYHASVVDLQPGQTLKNARYGGRVVLHLLEPEDFYYNSGTYFGKKDILALGAVVNYQKGVAGPLGVDLDNDFLGFSFDAMFEKNLGAPGTVTLEGGYWDFSGVGAGYRANQGTLDAGMGVATPYPVRSFFASGSWLFTNKVGVGHLQPNVRWQQAGDLNGRGDVNVFDVGVGYIIDGFNHRWHLNYRRKSGGEVAGTPSPTEDIVAVGAQIMI